MCLPSATSVCACACTCTRARAHGVRAHACGGRGGPRRVLRGGAVRAKGPHPGGSPLPRPPSLPEAWPSRTSRSAGGAGARRRWTCARGSPGLTGQGFQTERGSVSMLCVASAPGSPSGGMHRDTRHGPARSQVHSLLALVGEDPKAGLSGLSAGPRAPARRCATARSKRLWARSGRARCLRVV